MGQGKKQENKHPGGCIGTKNCDKQERGSGMGYGVIIQNRSMATTHH